MKRHNPSLFRFVVFCWSLGLLAGCARIPPIREPAVPLLREVVAPALQQRTDHWSRFQVTMGIQGESKDKRFSMDALMVAVLPDRVRLETFRFGQTASVLVVDEVASALYVPSDKVFYRAGSSEALIQQLLGFPIPVEIFGYLLAATVPHRQLEGFALSQYGDRWIGYGPNSWQGWELQWEFQSAPQAMTSVVLKKGETLHRIQYEPPVGLNVNDHPGRMTVDSSSWRIGVEVKDMKPVSAIRDTAFGLPPPPGVRLIDLSGPL